MLATALHFLKGTPYIYQGEELGMTNYPFQTLDDCIDVEIFNAYHELVNDKKLLTHEEMMKGICANSRDNARTPMQWDDSENAGFTKGTPWMKVNPNYKDINAKMEVNDSDSIYSYYKKLISLRHSMPVIVYGEYHLLEEEHPDLYIYTREDQDEKLLVITNFSMNEHIYELPKEFIDGEILISNQDDTNVNEMFKVLPYGAYVIRKHK